MINTNQPSVYLARLYRDIPILLISFTDPWLAKYIIPCRKYIWTNCLSRTVVETCRVKDFKVILLPLWSRYIIGNVVTTGLSIIRLPTTRSRRTTEPRMLGSLPWPIGVTWRHRSRVVERTWSMRMSFMSVRVWLSLSASRLRNTSPPSNKSANSFRTAEYQSAEHDVTDHQTYWPDRREQEREELTTAVGTTLKILRTPPWVLCSYTTV